MKRFEISKLLQNISVVQRSSFFSLNFLKSSDPVPLGTHERQKCIGRKYLPFDESGASLTPRLSFALIGRTANIFCQYIFVFHSSQEVMDPNICPGSVFFIIMQTFSVWFSANFKCYTKEKIYLRCFLLWHDEMAARLSQDMKNADVSWAMILQTLESFIFNILTSSEYYESLSESNF